jgi:3-oxoacyl-[acyl-carrier protein] reductase
VAARKSAGTSARPTAPVAPETTTLIGSAPQGTIAPGTDTRAEEAAVDDGRRRFEGQVVVVTGGGSGLGEAMCVAFAREGGRVAVVDLREEAAQTISRRCEGDARPYACDVADSTAVRETFARIERDIGPVAVLVNNAGIGRRDQQAQERMLAELDALESGGERQSLGATSSLSDEDWDRMIKVHLYGTFYCTREGLKTMEAERRGAILNLSSVAALQGLPGSPDYSAAKGAIMAMTKSVAREVIGAGIRVNAIAPGWIRTPMVQEEVDPRLLSVFLSQVPAGDLGEPEHVAALALHLCSDEAAYTTGQVMSPNGGLYT